MRYWNVSDRETPVLRRLGLVGVPVTVAGVTIQPGCDADIPVHALAEASPWVLRGVLATSAEPAPRQVPALPPAPADPVPAAPAAQVAPDPLNEKPVPYQQVTEAPAEEPAPETPPAPATDETRGSRKRRV